MVQIPSSDSIDSIPICINSNSIPIQTVSFFIYLLKNTINKNIFKIRGSKYVLQSRGRL